VDSTFRSYAIALAYRLNLPESRTDASDRRAGPHHARDRGRSDQSGAGCQRLRGGGAPLRPL